MIKRCLLCIILTTPLYYFVVVVSFDKKRTKKTTGKQTEQCLSNNDLVGVPVLVFANKQDSPEGISPEMLGSQIMDRDIFQNHSDHHVLGGSAWEGFGVKEGVQWLINVMKNNQYE